MIFKQIDKILAGEKTQTRRVVKDSEFGIRDQWVRSHTKDDVADPRLKWRVGCCYAVVPKRGEAGVWISPNGKWQQPVTYTYDMEWDDDVRHDARGWMKEKGWRPAQIRITGIHMEFLQDITEADARAEGVASVEEYRTLWESINGKNKATRWDANPEVWVLSFELVGAAGEGSRQ